MISIEELDGILERAEKIKNIMEDIEALTAGNEEKFIPASLDDRLLTVADVAERLKTSEASVRNLCKKGILPYLVIGNQKVRESTLVKFLADYEGFDLNGEEVRKIS